MTRISVSSAQSAATLVANFLEYFALAIEWIREDFDAFAGRFSPDGISWLTSRTKSMS